MGSRVIFRIIVLSFKMIYSSPHTDGLGGGRDHTQFRTGLCLQIKGQHNLAATNPRLQRSGGKSGARMSYPCWKMIRMENT